MDVYPFIGAPRAPELPGSEKSAQKRVGSWCCLMLLGSVGWIVSHSITLPAHLELPQVELSCQLPAH